MRKILNVGIVGCGKHARDFHIPSLLRLKNKFNITGLFDPDFSKTKNLKRKFKIKKLYTSFISLLNDKEIDVIDICSPPKYHYDQILRSIKKNKHVMVEKPIVIKSLNLKKIIDKNKLYKKKIFCLQQQNFRDETDALKKFLKEKKKILGRLLEIKATANVNLPKQSNNSFTDKKISGGGPLIDQGSHIIGLVAYLLNYPKIKNLKTILFKKRSIKKKNFIFNIETSAVLKLLFNNKINFEFNTSYFLKKRKNNFYITFLFEKSLIIWPSLDYFDYFMKKKKIKILKGKLLASDKQFAHVYNVIKNKHKPIVSLSNSLYTVKLIEDGYKFSKVMKINE